MPRQTDRREITRSDLLQAFWGLYARQPMESITVGQVCEEAGYSRATFYQHFHDLYEVLETIETAQLDGMAACVQACLGSLAGDHRKLARLSALKDVIAYYERNKRYVDVLLGTKADPRFVLKLKNRLKPLWRSYVVRSRADHSEAEIDLVLECTLTGTLFMVSSWLQNPGDVSKGRMGRLIYDVAIRDVSRRIEQ